METKYYLPINSMSLAHYFGSGLIKPSKYFLNKPRDLQDRFEEFLFLTNHHGTKEADCCLELVLTTAEVSDLVVLKPGFFLYGKPLPISRIKSVIFSDKRQKDHTITNVLMNTAFIPDKIIKVSKFDTISISGLDIPESCVGKDWSKSIKLYDSILGGLALMRLSGEEYMNYSESYFSTLAYFNDAIKNELEISGRQLDPKFHDAFIGVGNFKKLLPYLNKVINENDLVEIAQEEKQTIVKDRYTKIIDLTNLEKSATFTVAILETYGVGDEAKKKRIDGLIMSNFRSDIKPEKAEGIALCYGMNRGYSVFPSKYLLGNKEKIVKFELNSKVDYYTIESIFQFSFNNTKVGSLPYLDDWCPKYDNKNSKNKKNDYHIFDIVVIGKKKPRVYSPEYLSNLLQRFFQKDSEVYFKSLIDIIVTTVYNDSLQEFNDDLLLKEEEINRLQNENANISKLRSENERLILENLTVNAKLVESHKTYQEPSLVKSNAEEPTNNLTITERKKFIREVLAYKEKNKTSLEKLASERGLILPRGAKSDDIIVLLMTTSKDPIESKLPFSE